MQRIAKLGIAKVKHQDKIVNEIPGGNADMGPAVEVPEKDAGRVPKLRVGDNGRLEK